MRPQTIARHAEHMRSTFYRFALAAGDHFTKRGDAETYVAARMRGETPVLAFYRVELERAATAALLPGWDECGPEDLSAYVVSGPELARVTAGPALRIVLPDGSHPDGTVTLPDGWTCVVRVQRDDVTHPNDAECYSAEDVNAWHGDGWLFACVSATVILPNGDTGTAIIGGVELGGYWPGSEAAQLWDYVPDLVCEAMYDALAHTTDVSLALSSTLEV